MNKTKFTPGPWEIGNFKEKEIAYEVLCPSGSWLGPTMPALVGGRTKEDALANARLVSLAPDMYQAILDVADFCLHTGCPENIRLKMATIINAVGGEK